MKKKWAGILAICCYVAGIVASLYVGAWLMLLQPIHDLITAFGTESLTLPFLLVSILKIALSTTFAGLVWCIGYIGYNYFRGNEDPDWEALNNKSKLNKKDN